MLSNILDRISFWSLFITVTLLPIFFLPFTSVPADTSKGILLVLGLVISIIFWAAARFSDGKIVLPKSSVVVAGLGIVLSFLLASLFSSAKSVSFFGTMFDIGTFWFMFAAFLLMFVSSLIIRDPKKGRMLLLGIITSSVLALLFQLIRFFAPLDLSFGVLGNVKTANLIGSWNSFGIIASLTAFISLFVIEFFQVSQKWIKWLLGLFIVFSVFMSAAVNFPLVWELLGIFSLIIFVYKISVSHKEQNNQENKEDTKKSFPIFSFAIVLVCLLFFMSGRFIGTSIPNALQLRDVEVSPSLATTLMVTKEALVKSPLFGVGPNKFNEVWAMHKPTIINSSLFWDTPFVSSSGLIPTFFSTTGFVGILAWLLFFVFFIVAGIKFLSNSIRNNINPEAVIFFLASLYLFIASLFYSTGVTIFLLAFAFCGIFIGLYTSTKEKGSINLSFLDDPRKSFFSILFLVLLMVVSAGISFKYIERFASVFYFSNAVRAESIEKAEASIQRAILLYSNDLYLRTYGQIYLAKLNSLVNKGTQLTDEEQAVLQASFTEAVNGATSATTYNPNNYLNFQALGDVYSTVAVLGVEDAPSKAIEAYTTASSLNPVNPGLKLAIARVYLADNKTKEAKDFANEAMTLKPDFIEGLILLSQIEKKNGNNSQAIYYAEQALSLARTDKGLIDYVNSLKNGTTPTPVPEVVETETQNEQ